MVAKVKEADEEKDGVSDSSEKTQELDNQPLHLVSSVGYEANYMNKLRCNTVMDASIAHTTLFATPTSSSTYVEIKTEHTFATCQKTKK